MKIVFMGTPGFAVPSLNVLVESGFDIAAVVTAPDRPSGRGQKVQYSEVKKYALEKGLTVLQPKKLKSDAFLDQLKDISPDLMVVVAFRMLPKEVWDLPSKGTINLHASLLPNYRGAAPINWAIINGETETGATTFFINEKIDTGDIIDTIRIPILEKDTAGTLHDKLMISGADLLLSTVKGIQGGIIKSSPQNPPSVIKEAPKIFKEDTVIDFNRPAKEVIDFIRGLSPYPTASSTLINEKEMPIKIYGASVTDMPTESQSGKLEIQKNELLVSCSDYKISLEELQLAGKKRMKASDLLNGLTLSKEAKMS